MLEIAPKPVGQIFGDDVKARQQVCFGAHRSPVIAISVQILVLGISWIQLYPPSFHLLCSERKVNSGSSTFDVASRLSIAREPLLQALDIEQRVLQDKLISCAIHPYLLALIFAG